MSKSIGLIGCGRWGANILRDLRQLACHVHVVVPNSPGSSDRALFGGAKTIVHDIEELPAVDGIVIAVPTSLHSSIIESVLPLGVAIFVEKPFVTDVASARSLTDRAGDRVFVMDKWRYLAGVRTLGQLLRGGRLGTPEGLRTVRIDGDSAHDDVDAAWILAPHDLSIALEILGEVPLPEVAVCAGRGRHLDLTVIGRTSIAWHHLHISSRSSRSERRIEVLGSDATAVLDGGWADSVRVYHRVPDGALACEIVPASGELPLLAELRAFVGYLDGGPRPVSSAEDATRIVAAIASARVMAGLT
jgi:predicted dehydrogenase